MLHQDYNGRYEVIVVDNNSTDGTAAIAAQYGVPVVKEPSRESARRASGLIAPGARSSSPPMPTPPSPDWLRTIDARFAESNGVVAVAGPCRYQDPSWWAKAYPISFRVVAKVYALTGFVFCVSATNIAVLRTAFPGYDSDSPRAVTSSTCGGYGAGAV